MGKRKRAKPPPKKAKPKVAQIFDCPFCGKTESCHCKMDVDHSLGTILCDSCGAKYSMRINRLTDPIDVYSEWIDSAPHLRQHAHTLSIFIRSTLPLFSCAQCRTPSTNREAAASRRARHSGARTRGMGRPNGTERRRAAAARIDEMGCNFYRRQRAR